MPSDDLITSEDKKSGFTLIELSIVLVLIGLLVGGVLVGRDLIRASETSATIAQIQKYNSAVRNFEEKYGQLPGDMNSATATQFGFSARGSYCGEGDGNGRIDGVWANAAASCSGTSPNGEEGLFWVDLTTANGLNVNMIDGSFSTAVAASFSSNISGTKLNAYMPQAKLGRGNYIYVFGLSSSSSAAYPAGNFFGILGITGMNLAAVGFGCYTSTPSIPVRQAYDIDKKIDDGLPQSGNVLALYMGSVAGVGSNVSWSNSAYNNGGIAYTTATPGSSITCFDNGNSAGAIQQYSLGQSNGSNPVCALSLLFQ